MIASASSAITHLHSSVSSHAMYSSSSKIGNMTWTWSSPTVSGQIPSPRVGASITYLNLKGKRICVLFGGASHEEGFKNDVHVLDIKSMTWSAINVTGPSYPAPRYEHCASAARFGTRNECVWIFGGSSETGLLNDSWILDIENKIWIKLSPTGTLPSPRNVQSCGRVVGEEGSPDKFYIFAGGDVGEEPVNDVGVYCFSLDVKQPLWTLLSPPINAKTPKHQTPSPRLGHSTVLVPAATVSTHRTITSNRLLIWGGAVAGGGADAVAGGGGGDAGWIFDIDTCLWSVVPQHQQNEKHQMEASRVPDARYGHGAAVFRVKATSATETEEENGEKIKVDIRRDKGPGQDTKRMVMVVFGGMCKVGQPRVFDGLWGFDMDTLTWEKIDVVGQPPLGSPSGRLDFASCVVAPATSADSSDGGGEGDDQNECWIVLGGMDFGQIHDELFMLSIA